MKEKFTVAHILGDVSSDEFKDWPAHITVVPPVEGEYSEERFGLSELAREYSPIYSTTTTIGHYGPVRDIKVRKLELSDNFKNLQHTMVKRILAEGGESPEQHYRFSPHITAVGGGLIPGKNQPVRIDKLSVVQSGNGIKRVVKDLYLPENYIFLDIDGVIWSYKFRGANPEARMLDNDGKAMSLIGKLAVETAAQIIVHSSWRYTYDTFDELREALRDSGAEGDFYARLYDWTPKQKGSRGREINSWLYRHRGFVRNYAILDDAEKYNFLENQFPFLVTTTMKTGFTAKQYRYAKKCLKQKNG